jgi:hypothetical protein
MLPSLIDDRRRQQLDGIELAHGATIEPRQLTAGVPLKLRAPAIAELHINAVRAALVDENDSHGIAV